MRYHIQELRWHWAVDLVQVTAWAATPCSGTGKPATEHLWSLSPRSIPKLLADSNHFLMGPKITFPSKSLSFYSKTAASTIVLLLTVMQMEQALVQISANLSKWTCSEQEVNGVYIDFALTSYVFLCKPMLNRAKQTRTTSFSGHWCMILCSAHSCLNV